MRRLISTVALFAVTSCLDKGDRFSPIVVDIAANCAEAETQVLLADMDAGARPWNRVLAVAVDAAGLDSYWTLAEVDDAAAGGTRLALLHVAGSEIDLQYFVSSTAPISETTFELRPGPVPGTAWLIQKGTGIFRLWHVDAKRDPADPLVGVSPELGGFPSSSAYLCEGEFGGPLGPCDVSEWPRELAFFNGFPFVVAVPQQSPNGTTYVFVGRLEPYLAITDPATQLEFFRKCDSSDPIDEYTMCTEENAVTTYPSLTLMGSQVTADPPAHRMFLLRQRAIDGLDEPQLEVVFLRLYLDDRDNPAGILQSKVLDDVKPLTGTPSGLAIDDFATYMLHATKALDAASGGVGPPVVTRLSELEDEFDVLQGVTVPEDTDLLQLDDDLALGRVVDGGWEVTKLFPDAPERSKTVTYRGSDEITSVVPAGHGAHLLFKKSGGPDLVQVKCADDVTE